MYQCFHQSSYLTFKNILIEYVGARAWTAIIRAFIISKVYDVCVVERNISASNERGTQSAFINTHHSFLTVHDGDEIIRRGMYTPYETLPNNVTRRRSDVMRRVTMTTRAVHALYNQIAECS